MKLRDYLRELSPNQREELARRIGIQKIYLTQVAGGAVPSAPIAAEIHRATEGRVPVYELRPKDAHKIWPQSYLPLSPE